MSGTKRRNTWTISPAAAETPDDIAPRSTSSPASAAVAGARPGAAPAEMTEQAKHQAPCRSASPHGRRPCPPPGRLAVGQRGVGGHGRSAARRSARRRGFSGSPSRPSISGICMSISTASNGTLASSIRRERPPARRRRGPPGALAAQQLGGDLAVQRVVLHYQQTHAPQPLGALHRARRRAGRGALFAVQRMQHRVGQLLGRDRLGEKIDEGRRAVVARIGQHLAAIGGDRSPWAAAGRPATGGSVAPRRGRRDRACANPSAPRRSDGPRPSPPGPAPPPRCRCRRSRRASRGRRPCGAASPATVLSSASQQPQRFAGPGQGPHAVGSWATSRSSRTRTGYRCPARSTAIPRSPAIRN